MKRGIADNSHDIELREMIVAEIVPIFTKLKSAMTNWLTSPTMTREAIIQMPEPSVITINTRTKRLIS